MSHGWRGLVCRSACKPHFHLPIFTFHDAQRALFFSPLTVLQQVVSGKLRRLNTWTKLWFRLVEFLLRWKDSENCHVEDQTCKKENPKLSGAAVVSHTAFPLNAEGRKAPDLLRPLFPLLHYPQTLMHDGFWILHYVRGLGVTFRKCS